MFSTPRHRFLAAAVIAAALPGASPAFSQPPSAQSNRAPQQEQSADFSNGRDRDDDRRGGGHDPDPWPTGAVIYACLDVEGGNSGSVRIVRPNDDCRRGEIRVRWNVVGPVGPQGATGPRGATGPAGPMGPAGAAGATGSAGAQGPAGAIGPQGPAGNTGAIGPQGPQGLMGPQGLAGADGAQGAQGVAGPAGAVGPIGPQGGAGADGAIGPQGPQGSIGPMGPQGLAGADGAQGPQGVAGPAGAVGPIGPQGAAGADGAIGPQGPQGSIGPIGPQGLAGADGAQGPQGVAGPPGAIGPQGPAGNDGAVGPQGLQGPIGPIGPQGLVGNTGATGPQGPVGPAGSQGPAGNVGATGPQGPQGVPGQMGAIGPTGPAGQIGATGPQGAQGPAGLQGSAGATGATGPQGPQGIQGPAGSNANLQPELWRTTGRIGINDSAPDVALDVNGDMRANGYVAWGNAYTRTETRDNANTAGGRSGFFETSNPFNWYPNAASWQHLFEARHSNTANNYALQIGGSFFDQDLWYRKTGDGTPQWLQLIGAGPRQCTAPFNTISATSVATVGGIQRSNTLCGTHFMPAQPFLVAQEVCFAIGGHIQTATETYIFAKTVTLPNGNVMLNGDWIGNRVGDDTAMVVNNQANPTNFEGVAAITDMRQFRCVQSSTVVQ